MPKNTGGKHINAEDLKLVLRILADKMTDEGKTVIDQIISIIDNMKEATDLVFYIVGNYDGDVYVFTDKSEATEKAEHTGTGRVEVYWLKNNDLRHLETLYEDENWGEGIEERED